MVTLAAFRVRFPEFANAADGLVEAHLDLAAVSTPAATWGVLEDEGHGYLAAHLLAISPWGQNARMVSKSGESTYGTRYRALMLEVAACQGR